MHPRASLIKEPDCLLVAACSAGAPALAKSKVDKNVTYTVTFTAACQLFHAPIVHKMYESQATGCMNRTHSGAFKSAPWKFVI